MAMNYSGLLSHPDKNLEEHINGCLKHFRNEVSKLNFVDDKVIKTAEISIVCHDIGKATSYFQEYIRGGKESILSRHSLLSSIVAFFITKEVLEDDKLATYSFIACKNHHSNLWNRYFPYETFLPKEITIVSESISYKLNEIIRYLNNQVKSIDFKKFSIFVDNLDIDENLKKELRKIDKNTLNNWVENIEGDLEKIRLRIKVNGLTEEDTDNIDEYFRFLFIFSSLVYSDKRDAVLPLGFDFSLEYLDVNEEIVENYKKSITTNYSINTLRESAYKEVLGNDIEKLIEDNQRFFSITLPTGMGKTLTGFAFALKLRKFLKDKTKENYKVVYCLPFLSIIDQNFEVIRNVFLANGINPTSDKIIKHHHLSDLEYKTNDNKDEYNKVDIARSFIETWESNIIITTFVQFFLSVITNSNSSARRFIRIPKSIIILDEVQTIPHKYWDLVRKFLEEFANKFDVYVILMTATQPKLLKTFELVKNKEHYFKSVDRIVMSYDKEEMTIDKFLQKYNQEIRSHLRSNKRILFIFNTILSSKHLFRKLKREFKDVEATYLSSYVIPKQRLERIRDIRNGKYKILVSTQVVEAGVDIDFDIVYRDFGPIDSIIQSSGRCNRSGFNNTKGQFKIINIIRDPNDNARMRNFYSYVYDHLLCYSTKEVLTKYFNEADNIYESKFADIVDEYFSLVESRQNKRKSKDIIDAIRGLDFNTISLFSLIEHEGVHKADVFIEFDDEAKYIWEQVKNIDQKIRNSSSKEEFFSARNEFDKIKAIVYQYVVSVDTEKCNLSPGLLTIPFYVPYDSLSNFYDEEEGFKHDYSTTSTEIW